MASTVKFKIQNQFEDDTTRDLEFGPFAQDAINSETLRTNIKNFDVDAIKNYYLSDDGASFTGIAAATITELNERDIPLHG